MSVNTAKFPNWDGSTPVRVSQLDDKTPLYEDWDQVVAEILQIQSGYNQAAVASLTDSSGGSADGTLEALPGSTTAANATAANNNFAEINAKLDAILAALRTAGIILT